MGQGQFRVIIYINSVELEYILLHAKLRDHKTFSSVGEDFLKILTINEHGGYLGHVTRTIYLSFLSHFPRMLHTDFGFDWPSGSREDV